MKKEELCSNEEVDRRIMKISNYLDGFQRGKLAGIAIDDEPGNLQRYKDALARLAPELVIEYEGPCEAAGVTIIRVFLPIKEKQ